MMETIPIDLERDSLVFMGDYIDRGPNSVEVVDFLIQLKSRVPGVIFLKGNHEDMLVKFISGEDRFTYLLNGGQQTLDSYLRKFIQSEFFPIPDDHMEFFKSLRLCYETEEFIFVHAGLRPRVPLKSQSPEDMLWIREKFVATNYDFGKRVIFGHTPLKQPLVEPNKIGIDTGAVYGNALTCLQLPDIVFFKS
jgi:diadenosine tetraphosphatase ApaH/serine/threonine PP2A family protein phosphatase